MDRLLCIAPRLHHHRYLRPYSYVAKQHHPPASSGVSDAYPFIVVAIIVHGTYNGIVLLAEVFGLSF